MSITSLNRGALERIAGMLSQKNASALRGASKGMRRDIPFQAGVDRTVQEATGVLRDAVRVGRALATGDFKQLFERGNEIAIGVPGVVPKDVAGSPDAWNPERWSSPEWWTLRAGLSNAVRGTQFSHTGSVAPAPLGKYTKRAGKFESWQSAMYAPQNRIAKRELKTPFGTLRLEVSASHDPTSDIAIFVLVDFVTEARRAAWSLQFGWSSRHRKTDVWYNVHDQDPRNERARRVGTKLRAWAKAQLPGEFQRVMAGVTPASPQALRESKARLSKHLRSVAKRRIRNQPMYPPGTTANGVAKNITADFVKRRQWQRRR